MSSIGDWCFKLAIPILVWKLTNSAFWMSVAYAAAILPFVLIMPLGGVIGDMFSRKILLLFGDLISGLLCILLVVYLALGGTNHFIIMLIVFCLGAVFAIYHPSFQGIIPQLVSPDKLSKANSLNSISDNMINMLGTVISGILLSIFKPETVILLNALSFVISFIFIYLIKVEVIFNRVSITIAQIIANLKSGYMVAMSQPIIKYGTLLFILFNFASNLIMGNFIYYLTKVLSLTPEGAGSAIALSSIGALIGALIAPKLIRQFIPGRLMIGCTVISSLGILVLLFTNSLTGVVIGRAISMMGDTIIVVTMFTLRQKVIPNNFLSRVVAITRTISFIPIPIASIFGGFLLSQFGNMQLVFIISFASLWLCIIISLFTPFVAANSHLVKPNIG